MPCDCDLLLLAHQVGDLREEPGVDPRGTLHLVERHAGAERVGDVAQPVRAGHPQLLEQGVRASRR